MGQDTVRGCCGKPTATPQTADEPPMLQGLLSKMSVQVLHQSHP